MTYKAKITFRDLQDNEHFYQVGDIDPRDGYEPSSERIAEVIEKGGIEEVKPLTVKEIEAQLDEAGVSYDSTAKKADLEELLKDAEEV